VTPFARWTVSAVAVVLLPATGAACEDDADRPIGKAKEVPCRSVQPETGELFMDVDANEMQVAQVRGALRRSDGTYQFCFLSKEDAYREFRRLFDDKPDLIEETDPAELPASFRVSLVETSSPEEFRRKFERLPGVDQIALVTDAFP
jgi:cell division protein FtsX